MSFNSKAYLAYEERLQEPGIIVKGSYRRHKETPAWKVKQDWINSLSLEQQQQLIDEQKSISNDYR